MSLIVPYKRLNRLFQQETFEPTLNWGIRMGIASVVPMVWGVATDNLEIAKWITLTAECICWVELRGSAGLRLRVLTGGALLALFFAFLGSITGAHLWAGVVGMLFVGFISGLFKNLGDRGSGLAVCVFVLFIIGNAYPPASLAELEHRCLYVLIGGVWNLLVGMAASAFIRVQEPYRRSIAVIWKSISGLIASVAEGWDGKAPRSGLRDIYLREQSVRTAIDSSLHFYESMAHQVTGKDNAEYQLAQTRKATALVAAHVNAMSEELETLQFSALSSTVRLKVYTLFRALQQASDRMAIYILTLKPEEELLLQSRLRRLNKLIQLLREYPFAAGSAEQQVSERIIRLMERTVRLMESCMRTMEKIGAELPVYRSYSLIKTIYVLHPKYLFRNIRLLFNFNTFMVRYALRTALASAVALWVYLWFEIDHGYWIPFTVIIVIQPYFGATLKKAGDRIAGTLLGGLVGGLILRLPAGLYLQEGLLLLCSVLMIYYLRKKYSVAVFFMTLSLVLVFAVDQTFDPNVIWIRALSTMTGAAIAVTAGFVLLPLWDRNQMPGHLAAAIDANYAYFKATFFPEDKDPVWTRFKRTAETRNSNLFDSFIRYMDEPASKKRQFVLYYQLITHNVRLTRELNNIHLETENRDIVPDPEPIPPEHQARIQECAEWFGHVMHAAQKLNPEAKYSSIPIRWPTFAQEPLTPHEMLYLGRMTIELKTVHTELERLLGSRQAADAGDVP